MAEQFDENGQAVAEFLFAGRKLRVVYELEMERGALCKDSGKMVSPCGKNVESLTRADHGYCVASVTAHGKQFGVEIPRTELASWNEDEVHEIVITLR